MYFVIFSIFIHGINSGAVNVMKEDICAHLQCDDVSDKVCGIRAEGEGFRLKLFQSECDLLRYKCNIEDENSAYDTISMDYCLQVFKPESSSGNTKDTTTKPLCIEYDCSYPTDTIQVCGIKNDGAGFRVRLFENKCQLWKYNCDNQKDFSVTDLHICKGMELPENTTISDDFTEPKINDDYERSMFIDNLPESVDNPANNDPIEYDPTENDPTENDTTRNPSIENDPNKYDLTENDPTENNPIENNPTGNAPTENDLKKYDPTQNDGAITKYNNFKNIIVVRSPLIDFSHINESIANFFAATHVFDLPMREMDRSFLNETTRRRLVKVAGPIKVFVPWVTIPRNISDDYEHRPTLSTCYHKCPRKCPDTYSPVCGVPGIVAREPSLMFQNHCFMDVAQCKMYWEHKSPTALSSSYVESSFLFCLGDEMNGMYRFLPLIRTLQHMGRLRKKGRFHYRFKNMKFFNNLLARQPKFMGK